MTDLKRGHNAYWLRGGRIVPVTVTRKAYSQKLCGSKMHQIGIRLKNGERLHVHPGNVAPNVDELVAILRESKRQAIQNAELQLKQAEAEVERRRAEVERLYALPDPKVEE